MNLWTRALVALPATASPESVAWQIDQAASTGELTGTALTRVVTLDPPDVTLTPHEQREAIAWAGRPDGLEAWLGEVGEDKRNDERPAAA